MKIRERARLLLLRKRVSLAEAPYIVAVELEGGYDDAFSLLLEAIKDGTLHADINPTINPWNDDVVASVDPHDTTIAVADLIVWLRDAIELVPQELPPKLAAVAQYEGGGLLSPRVARTQVEQPESSQSAPEDRHTLKGVKQEAAVLDWLRTKGYNPTCLPKRKPGRAWVKADVKKAMLENPALFTDKSFELTWERLRETKQIEEAESTPPSN